MIPKYVKVVYLFPLNCVGVISKSVHLRASCKRFQPYSQILTKFTQKQTLQFVQRNKKASAYRTVASSDLRASCLNVFCILHLSCADIFVQLFEHAVRTFPPTKTVSPPPPFTVLVIALHIKIDEMWGQYESFFKNFGLHNAFKSKLLGSFLVQILLTW